MSSILTNTGALTALQTLKLTNQSLEDSSNHVATGQKVATAKDSAAYWSIATTLRSDNSSTGAVKDALSLGGNSVNVAAQGLSKVGEILTKISGLLAGAASVGADRFKLQGDIDAQLVNLKQAAAGATLNGESWLSVDSTSGNGYQNVRKIVSSFTRVQGNIQIDSIEVNVDDIKLYDKNTTAGTTGTSAGATGGTTWRTAETTFKTATATWEKSSRTDTDKTTYDAAVASYNTAKTTYESDLKTKNASATTGTDGTGGLLNKQIGVFGEDENGYKQAYSLSVDTIRITNVQDTDLSKVRAYINLVDKVTKSVTSVAAALGGKQSQVDSQKNFLDTLQKANTTSIGVLVDADMEEESTKLKALQVQQQLGVQALTIANTSTQQILSLFRG
ncbi:flagellin [Methylobacterium brachiatum]|uniref:flagellin N-terminal helical domain-containing protein n=1 Tax=Methylobacterium brachiatum TaxID=269660 RepID=UPI000EFAD9B8|nr:flagellin [Methylobacterium brachiatum]AYO81878.1 flagellin [Methylobacterium brachiatum]